MLVREDSLDREYEKHKPFKSESENLSTIIIIINLSIKENSISKKFIHLIKIIKEKKKMKEQTCGSMRKSSGVRSFGDCLTLLTTLHFLGTHSATKQVRNTTELH